MTSTKPIKLLHVGMSLAKVHDMARVDIVRLAGRQECIEVITEADGWVGSEWTPFKGLDHYRDQGFEVTFEAIAPSVKTLILRRINDAGIRESFEWVTDVEAIGKLFWYVVEGMGDFGDGVDDMLRRDRSRPASQRDAAVMKAGLNHPLRHTNVDGRLLEIPRRIKLVTAQKHGSPLTKRWESFGWKVVELDPEIWWAEVSKPMGRPRRHPKGTTASDRAKVSNDELRKSGGARRTFALSKEALDALTLIREVGGDANDTAAVERLLKDAARDIRISL